MKRLSSRHQPRLITEIQVTPLMDLMLLVVLVVMVAMPWGKRGADPVSDRPQPSASVEPTSKIDLRVAADLRLTLAGKPIEHQDLIADLQKRVAAEPALGVVVHVPESLTAPRLLELMEALRSSAVAHTAVVTVPTAKP
jgi:biopolymer transport protein ExbD